MTPFSEVFKKYKQKFVQTFKYFKNHAVCSNHNPALQNLQKYFALQFLHCLQRPIVDSRMLGFRCRSFLVYICYLRLSSCVYYLLFVCYFFLFQNIRIKKLRDDTGWVSQTQMPSKPKRAQELF
jgi:hypothetical protein